MGGYLQISELAVVLDLFKKICLDGLDVDTMLNALAAVGDLGHLLGGESLLAYCMKAGYFLNMNMVAALIYMYGKIGSMDLGHRFYYEVLAKDVVLWNYLIDGYAKKGLLEESLAILHLMNLKEVKPNSSTLAGLLSACAASGALGIGQRIFDFVEEQELVLDAVLGTAFVHMYSKCGLLGKGIHVFNKMESKDVKSWTTMIMGFGVHGQAKNAITLFHQMEEDGLIPNEVSFLEVLSACCHGGLVTEDMICFERMVRDYGWALKIERYGCLIELLGHAELLEEAHGLIKSLPIKGDATALRALLAACRVRGNTDLGECVMRELEMYKQHPADSIILCSAYAISGRLPDHTKVFKDSSEPLVKKETGCSMIELDNKEWE